MTSPLLASINKFLLLKSLIHVSFLQHNLYMFYHTKSMLLKHTNLQRKNDTQEKEGGEEMLPHFPPKPHLK